MKYQKQKKYAVLVLSICMAGMAFGTEEDRIAQLEKQMEAAQAEIASLKGSQSDLSMVEEQTDRLHVGGYGEIHANFIEDGNDIFDIHRLVMYVGYDFNDWIKLTAETELEHAFVNDGDGEISIEQLYADFLFTDAFNVRAGRVLAPLGIINQHHEPVLFNGVERPNVERAIIPSTWSLDGIGVFGYPLSWLSYEAYVVAGLDGEQFSASSGVRSGRIKERGDLGDPAVAGRLDFYPLINADVASSQNLRLGISGYYGGTDNSNNGGGNGVDNEFGLVSADFEYDISRFQFRGVVAYGENSDADALQAAFTNNVGEAIFGWYLEGGVSILPESWKSGKLAEADVIPFIRYEEYDTQHDVPAGVTKNGNNERSEITVGVNFPLTQQFVLKTDYQFRYDDAGEDPNNTFNLGMGWIFQ